MKQKRAAVMGGNGFIGHHLVNYLKKKGYFVRVVDIAFEEYDTTADEVLIYDLRDEEQAMKAIINGNFDEVYQLAADMGGMGFIHFNELDTLTHNVKINMNVLKAARLYDVKKYFYSSSVCVYPDMRQGAKRLKEEDVYPAMPDNQYGWEKLYSERIALQYAKDYKMDIRIARFENCFDEKTEILTRMGFKKFKDIDNDDWIATKNPSSGKTEYHRPLAIQKKQYKGKMLNIDKPRINLCVTPDHSMYYSLRRDADFQLAPFEQIAAKKNIFLTREIVPDKTDRQLWFNIPEVKYKDGRTMVNRNGGAKTVKMQDWLTFLGWYLSEGSAFITKQGRYRVVISQYNTDNQQEMLDITRKLGFKPFLSTDKKAVIITSKQLHETVKGFGTSADKYIPRDLLRLPSNYLRYLFNSLMKGDGNSNGRRYTTKSQQLANDMQELVLKLGKGSHIRQDKSGIYRVSVTSEVIHRISPHDITESEYDGMVYDVTVPNHIIMVRRKGKVIWTGNCYGPEGTWVGGREKVPAAICRKIANAGQVKTIEIWGDGTAVRNFIYVDDLVEAIYKLMHSGIESPVNIGTETNYSVNELVETIAKVADKEIKTKTVEGPIGVQSRNFSHDKIRSLGWKPKHTLLQGIKKTYPWIKKQIDQ